MHGLYLLWWVQEKQLPPALVATMLATGDLAVMALELPTGWLADRCGHRRSLIAGSAVQVVGMLACWLGDGVVGLLTASVLVASGDALRSGADQALLYRSCAALGGSHDFQRIQARTEAAELCALVLLTTGGGLMVAAWGFAVGWMVEAVICTIGLTIACAMVEPPPAAPPTADGPTGAWRALLSRRILVLVAPAALVGNAAGVTSFLAQTAGDHAAPAVAALAAGITLAEAAGSALVMRAGPWGWRRHWTLAVAAVALALAHVVVPGFIVPTAIGLSLLAGVAAPLRAAAIQRAVADEARARAASLAHACDMAISAIALPLAGAWAGRRAPGRAFRL